MKKLQLEELNRVNVSEFKAQTKTPVVVVLDNVRSMHNVGAIFRTADAFSIEEISLCGITARPPHREIEKSALGATKSVNWNYYETTEEAVAYLKNKGYTILGVEQAEGSVMLQNFLPQPNQKCAFIFGNEVDGVAEDIMSLLDDCIEIPQFGTKHSLNISVTTGIILWDYISKTSFGSK